MDHRPAASANDALANAAAGVPGTAKMTPPPIRRGPEILGHIGNVKPYRAVKS
jgi:hypothetical protein